VRGTDAEEGRCSSPGLARHGHGAGIRWASAGLDTGPNRTGSGGGLWFGTSWAAGPGCNDTAWRRVEGAATDFGYWDESNRGLEVEEGKGKRKGFLFIQKIFS
jgi:hypothetical protein